MKESVLLTPDTGPEPSSGKKEAKDKRTDKRKKAGNVGFIAVESKEPAKAPEPPKPKRFMFGVDQPKEPAAEAIVKAPKAENFEAAVAEVAEATPPASEESAPSDGSLSPEEVKTAVKVLAEARLEEKAAAPEGESAPEQAVDEEVFYLQRAAEHSDPDMALQEALEKYELEAPAEQSDGEVASLDSEGEFAGETGEIDLNEASAEGLPEFEPTIAEHQEDDPVLANGGSSGAGGNGPGGPSGGTPGQPHNPWTTGGPGGPHGPNGPGGPGGPNGNWGPNFNQPPAVPLPTANQAPRQPELRRGANPATMALVGGIIGYLVGRRRGRIKTERKLKPVQRRLEQEVDSLQWKLQENEKKLQKAVAAKRRRETPVAAETLVAAAPSLREEAQPVRAQEQEPLSTAQRKRAPEAHHLHGAAKAHEHIGQVLVAESAVSVLAKQSERLRDEPRASKRESLKQATEQQPKLSPETQAETMSRTELLQMSEKIVVEGSSLRQIYETHLIGERGLRRLIAEHLRGGDMKKALKREVVEREIDFERDPAMRDLAARDGGAGAATGGGTTSLNQMIAKAASQVGGDDEQLAYYKARNDYVAQQHEEELKQRRLLDVGITTVIAVLVTIIVFIIITRVG